MPERIIETQILCIGLLVLGSYFMGKLTRLLKVGETTGQLVGGLLVGPYFLNMVGILPISGEWSECYWCSFGTFHFFSFVFLGLIAFGIGEELHINRLKAVGMKAVIICGVQAVLTFILSTAVFLWLGYEPLYALLIGSIGIATAPATTFAIMNKIALEGKLRDMLANIVVLADIIEVIVFSIIFQFVWLGQKKGATGGAGAALWPAFKDLGLALLIGVAIFLALKLIIRDRGEVHASPLSKKRKYTGFDFLSNIFQETPTPSIEVLLLIMGFIALGVGIGMSLHVPFLITTVVAGFCIANFHNPMLFDSLKIANVMPMFHLLFFAIIGANIRLDTFQAETFTFVLAYIATRGVGKLFGTWLGAKITGQGPKLCRLLPLLMLPQAGVAAVEAYFVGVVLTNGEAVVQIILPALVIFEIAGVVISERALMKWKSWTVGEEEVLKRPEKTSRIERLRGGTLLARVLTPDTVKIPLFGSTKEDAIKELVEVLEKAQKIPTGTPLVEEVMEREKLAPTGLGNGVALPHGRSPEISSVVCALGIKTQGQGLDFGANDGTDADIVFLVVSPEEQSGEHLQMLAAIALLVKEEEKRNIIRYAADAHDVIGLLAGLGGN